MKSKLALFMRFYLALLILALLLGNIDYELAKRDARVRLSIPMAYYSDGGSVERIGFGYTLVHRHEIAGIEDDRTYYLVGPKLKAWNVFKVFGARMLFDRHYGERVYYPNKDQSERVVRTTIAGDGLEQKLFLAFIDLAPLAFVLALFAIWNRIRRRNTPANAPSEKA